MNLRASTMVLAVAGLGLSIVFMIDGLGDSSDDSNLVQDRVASVLLQNYGGLVGNPQINARAGDSALTRFDAVSGAPLADATPIVLHRYASGLVAAPDGQTIVMKTLRYSGAPTIQLVDLTTGLLVSPDGHVSVSGVELGALRWSTDGRRVFWIQSRRGIESTLWSLDVASGQASLVSQLDGIGWGPPLVSPDGGTIYALRRPCCTAAESALAPYLIALDADSGREVARVELLGQYVSALPLHDGNAPAIALSPDGSQIYVVGADADVLTLVTTVPLKVAGSVEFGAESNSSASGEVANASPTALSPVGTTVDRIKTAEVSPDGRLLYITGIQYTQCLSNPDEICRAREPLGLKVLDLDTMQVVQQLDAIDQIELSWDRGLLVGTGSTARWDEALGSSRSKGSGLSLVDVATGDELGALEAGTIIDDATFSANGEFLYYVSHQATEACPLSCTVLTVIKVEGREVVSTHILGPQRVGLIALPIAN